MRIKWKKKNIKFEWEAIGHLLNSELCAYCVSFVDSFVKLSRNNTHFVLHLFSFICDNCYEWMNENSIQQQRTTRKYSNLKRWIDSVPADPSKCALINMHRMNFEKGLSFQENKALPALCGYTIYTIHILNVSSTITFIMMCTTFIA